jgi:hypothetical protein
MPGTRNWGVSIWRVEARTVRSRATVIKIRRTFGSQIWGAWCNIDAACDQLQQDSARNQNVHLVTPTQLINKQTAATILFLLAVVVSAKTHQEVCHYYFKLWLSTYTYYVYIGIHYPTSPINSAGFSVTPSAQFNTSILYPRFSSKLNHRQSLMSPFSLVKRIFVCSCNCNFWAP